jgi:tetratricopeptide (TPR) repeat protein
LGLAQCDLRDGALESAIQRYQALASDRRLTVLERANALEQRGDIEVIAERPAAAVKAYAEVGKLNADEDRQRTLEVKTFAALQPPASGVRLLLIGDAKRGPSWDEAAPTLGVEAERGDPLSQYLLGRNLWLHGRPEAALRYLDQSLDPSPAVPRSGYTWPPVASIVREATRLRIVVSCSDPKLGRAEASDDARRFREDPNVPAAKKEAVLRFARRCGLN